MEGSSSRERLIYLDVLRIIAAFMVVLLHASSDVYIDLDVTSTRWLIVSIYRSISTVGVPVFFMISGALNLSYDQSINKIHMHKLPHIIIPFLIWSIIFCLKFTWEGLCINSLIKIINGPGYYWFLFVMVGLYLITPLLREAIKDEKNLKYMCLLGFIILILLQSILMLIPKAATKLSSSYNLVKSSTFTIYILYYVLGYYLSKIQIKRVYAFLVTLVCFLSEIILNYYMSISSGVAYQGILSQNNIMVFSESVGLFMFIKSFNFKSNPCILKFFVWIADSCYGIYLSHIFVNSLMWNFITFDVYKSKSYILVPLASLGIFVVSLVIVSIIRKIPILKNIV